VWLATAAHAMQLVRSMLCDENVIVWLTSLGCLLRVAHPKDMRLTPTLRTSLQDAHAQAATNMSRSSSRSDTCSVVITTHYNAL
jgi:hypothetical protein